MRRINKSADKGDLQTEESKKGAQSSSDEAKTIEETKYFFDKYQRQFNTIFAAVDTARSGELDSPQLNLFLQQFGCVVQSKDPQEALLVKDFWNTLEGDKNNHITRENLFITLQKILKIPNPGSIPSAPSPQEKQLQKKYYSFLINSRFSNVALRASNSELEEDSHAPAISKASEKYARIARNKLKSNRQCIIFIGKFPEGSLTLEEQWIFEKRELDR